MRPLFETEVVCRKNQLPLKLFLRFAKEVTNVL